MQRACKTTLVYMSGMPSFKDMNDVVGLEGQSHVALSDVILLQALQMHRHRIQNQLPPLLLHPASDP